MSKVYVTQIPHKYDEQVKAFVPTLNITPASEYGEVVIMMPPTATFHATMDLVKKLRGDLCNYNFDEGDCIVSIGDPSIIAVACAILGRDFGKFTLLKWDRNMKRYLKSKIQI